VNTAVHAPIAPLPGWRWERVLLAPHRLGFLLAMAVLAAAATWWLLVQLGRAGLVPVLPPALSPSLVHATVMSFGAMPLFFCGFLFTAGPRWLGVRGPAARDLLPALVLQATGWFAWVAGAHWHVLPAALGVALAACGLALATLRFGRLVAASSVPDRLHARVILGALALGCVCLAGVAVAVLLEEEAVARQLVLTGLWGFIVVVYVAVAHRMIPFFTATALPFLEAWRPGWVLALMTGVAGFEALAVWLDPLFADAIAWQLLRGTIELFAGGVLLALALAWGLLQSLRIRLLAMLHLGFLWLGLALALSGVTQLATAFTGTPLLPLAPLHALAMGCLGSLMLAMVTRVACGHGGRAVVADDFLWTLFWLLQAAVLARIAAAALPLSFPYLAAAALWAAVVIPWSLRYGNWLGRARADGRAG
jgi:uncharacterized protein involved in response to NO